MRIGKLDRRIVIEQQVTAKDDWNYDYTTWTTYATVWANKMDKGATEREEVDRQTALTRTIWNIRYNSGVNATMRISFGGLYYYITGVEEVNRRQEMNVYTELRN
jgi:SPP1 family predicted phage head-tail adaptor